MLDVWRRRNMSNDVYKKMFDKKNRFENNLSLSEKVKLKRTRKVLINAGLHKML